MSSRGWKRREDVVYGNGDETESDDDLSIIERTSDLFLSPFLSIVLCHLHRYLCKSQDDVLLGQVRLDQLSKYHQYCGLGRRHLAYILFMSSKILGLSHIRSSLQCTR